MFKNFNSNKLIEMSKKGAILDWTKNWEIITKLSRTWIKWNFTRASDQDETAHSSTRPRTKSGRSMIKVTKHVQQIRDFEKKIKSDHK